MSVCLCVQRGKISKLYRGPSLTILSSLQGYDEAEESPSLADLSSNNLTPEAARKDRQHKKTASHKRKEKKTKKVIY